MCISHRGKAFKDLYKSVSVNLRKLLNIPDTHHIFFTASSLESMERVIENTVAKKSFHIVTGAFGKRFHKTALELGKKAEKIAYPAGEGWNSDKIKVPKGTELIAITQNDTSTGVSLPMEEIYALGKKYPDAMIAIDVVSSAPYTLVDYERIDMAFFSVQKGFGLPAGLGLLIVSEKAVKKARALQKKGLDIGSYHNFVTTAEKEMDFQTTETPNVFTIYLFNKILEDFLKIGIDQIRQDTIEKAHMIYNFFEKHQTYEPFVKDARYRSLTSLVIDVKEETEQIAKRLAQRGLILGKGYGDYKAEHIRLANFPSQTKKDVKKLLSLLSS